LPMVFSDALRYRWTRAARERVEMMRRLHPEDDRRQLAQKLITDKAVTCGAVGALTALPAIVPGFGTLIAILSGVMVDVMVLGALLYRLVLEMSIVYDRDPNSIEVQKEALWVFGMAAGVQSAGKKAARITAQHLSAQMAATGMHRPLIFMGLRASQRSVLGRVIPLFGVAVAGGISFFFARAVGNRIFRHYEGGGNERTGSWNGRTIEADYRVLR